MRYFRCKCGKSEAYGSDSPPPCDGCDVCGTTLASSPEFHRTPEPHRFGEPEWKIDATTGERWQERRCQNGYCRRTERVEQQPLNDTEKT